MEALEAVTSELLEMVSSFPQEELNRVPGKGGWTAAQVAEHLRKSDTFICTNLYGNAQAAHRAPDEHVENIRSTFLSADNKFNAPEIITPGNRVYDKAILLADLQHILGKVNLAARTLDLTEICRTEALGELSRLEMLYFVVFHTKRHIRQMERIKGEGLQKSGDLVLS